jgi:serine/threonine-protein kinase HipA
MSLEPNGRLIPSVGTSFSHILKPAGTSGFEALPLMEWIGLCVLFAWPCALRPSMMR